MKVTSIPLLVAVIAVASFVVGSAAQEGAPAPPAIPVDQRDYEDSANGCGPATILNLLRFGGAEFRPALRGLVGSTDGVLMRFLVDRYFRNRPSSTHPGWKRWGVHGIEGPDLAAGLNELLEEHGIAPTDSTFLDRRENESETSHLDRVHRLFADSLERGTPPLLSLRSFVVRRRERLGGEPHWETGFAHYVLVTALRGAPSPSGFEIEAIDPWRGRRTILYVHREANGQSFLALKGNAETGTWLEGRPFLQVLAPEVPTLRPADLEWDERYLVVADFLIGRL